jgi:phosphoribosylformylglycinamidine synthase subunit PurS
MKFIAEIDIMPHKELLDPQGKTVSHSLHNMGFGLVQDVRIGKHVRMSLDAANEAEARTSVDAACKQLLANAVMESYTYQLHTN